MPALLSQEESRNDMHSYAVEFERTGARTPFSFKSPAFRYRYPVEGFI